MEMQRIQNSQGNFEEQSCQMYITRYQDII